MHPFAFHAAPSTLRVKAYPVCMASTQPERDELGPVRPVPPRAPAKRSGPSLASRCRCPSRTTIRRAATSLRLTCGATVARERTRGTGEVTVPTSASGSYMIYTTASPTRVGHGAQRKGGTLVGKSLGASRQERQKVTPKSRAPEARPGCAPLTRPLGGRPGPQEPAAKDPDRWVRS